MPLKITNIVLAALAMVVSSSIAFANNLSISNVSLATRDPGTKTLVVSFDAAWENSWRNKINHDAVWLTVRLNAQSSGVKTLCEISASGINPVGSSTGSASELEFYVPADKKGAFLRRSNNGNVSNIAAQNLQLTINYASCGFADNDQVAVSMFAVEMAYVPQGSFYAGDFNGSTASLNKGSADVNPWSIASENAVSVSNAASNGLRYTSNSNAGEYATGALFTIPAAFPKGYQPFYVMKYEITEGQWVEFINSLPAEARAQRDLTDSTHKNSDSIIARNTISCSSNPLTCTTQRPSRAVSFLSWMDLAAFLDWNALRPMSELEFEKTARGPVLPVSGEYVWGNTTIAAADAISGTTEDGTESITTINANAHYGNQTLTGADALGGAENQTGALRNGIFAQSDSTRTSAGAGYYGIMDLGGNVSERVVTIGNATGLVFTGVHGDGALTTAAGYEGNANADFWPGFDGAAERGVTSAAGSGFRGGSWMDDAELLRTSDRSQAALNLATATSAFGGRGVRTYDGN